MLAVFSVVMLLPEMAFAQTITAGDDTLRAITDAFQSNGGVIVGLLLAMLGLWQWIVSQNSWGLVMIIGGVIITAFPGLFQSMQDAMEDLFGQAGITERAGNASVIDNNGG